MKLNYAMHRRITNIYLCVYGPFYRIGAKSGWKYFENLYVLFRKLCPYIYFTISKVHISSKWTVNFYVLECFSSPKNCHYRNIVINYRKNVLLLTCSDCVSFPSLKSIFYKYFLKVFTMKSIQIKFLPNFKVQFIQFIKI